MFSEVLKYQRANAGVSSLIHKIGQCRQYKKTSRAVEKPETENKKSQKIEDTIYQLPTENHNEYLNREEIFNINKVEGDSLTIGVQTTIKNIYLLKHKKSPSPGSSMIVRKEDPLKRTYR